MAKSEKPDLSSTVLRAIKVLNYLKEAPGPQSLSDISRDTKLSQTAVHRLLNTLKVEGFVYQHPQTKLYSLGIAFIDFAYNFLTDMPIAPFVEPHLSRLRDQSGETVGFYVPIGNERVCVLEFESQQEIRRSVGIGRRHPLYRGASGRALLAHMPKDYQERILSFLPLEEREKVKELLDITRKDGYSINEGEITESVGALSVPVFDQHQKVIGALSVSGPLFRWNKETMLPFVPILKEASKTITSSM